MEKKNEYVVEFQIGDLVPIGLALVVSGLVLAYGLDIMSDVSEGMTASSVEKNATVAAINGVAVLPSKLPTIATVVVAAIVIGILVKYFGGVGGSR